MRGKNMKMKISLISLMLLGSCANFTHQHVEHTPSFKREIASISPLTRFLEASLKSSDNVYKSVDDMERKLLKEIQSDPARYGIPKDYDMSKVKKLDDLPSERVIAEVIADAPRILKFSSKTQKIAFDAIQSEAGLAARISVGTSDLSHVKISMAEETGLGRRVSQQIKNVEYDLVKRGVASQKEAKEIADHLFLSARELAKKAKDDPALKAVARQIVEYSTVISQKTGKKFLGKGGCFKVSGADVLGNKAEIAYRTMKEVDEKGLKNYDELGESLQRNHAEVTNRTRKESCQAIKALAVGSSCGDVYARNLAPSGC
jgi:polyhydroxyalkanoate synthesis regulator phasin